MTEDLDDLMCPHSAAGRPERFPAKACILAGECGCAYGAEWSRALRLADDAAESVICTEGHNTEGRQWVLYPEQIAADPYLSDCIAHLEWRGIARRVDAEDGCVVVFLDREEHTFSLVDVAAP